TRRPTTWATSTRSRSSCSLSSLIPGISAGAASSFGGERGLDRVAHSFSFRPAGDLRHERLHHRSHPLRVLRTRLRDRLVGEGEQLLVAELARKERLEDEDLRLLVLAQLGATAALELASGIATLLDERLGDL